jgi:26S proteasome non-ATPase regulatory subunit 10
MDKQIIGEMLSLIRDLAAAVKSMTETVVGSNGLAEAGGAEGEGEGEGERGAESPISPFNWTHPRNFLATPFIVACKGGKLDAVKYLATVPAVVAAINQMDAKCRSGLHFACHAGHVEVVDFLLTLPGIKPNQLTKGGRSAFEVALCAGNVECAKLLLSHFYEHVHSNGTKAEAEAEAETGPGNGKTLSTPLVLAIKMNQMSSVEFLLSLPHIDINEANKITGETALHAAADSGDASIIKFLLSQQAIQFKPDVSGNTPLHIASSKHYAAPCVDALLGAGTTDTGGLCDINAQNFKGMTALSLACRRGHHKIVESLVRVPACDLNMGDCHRRSPLMLAVLGDHQKVVSFLCSLPGVEVGSRDYGEMTPEDAAKSEAMKGIFNQLPLDAEAEAAASTGTVAGAAAGQIADRSAAGTGTGTTESSGNSSDETETDGEAAVTADDLALVESGDVSPGPLAAASASSAAELIISHNLSLEIGSEVVRGPAWDCK